LVDWTGECDWEVESKVEVRLQKWAGEGRDGRVSRQTNKSLQEPKQ
jgi:hypothetical protein